MSSPPLPRKPPRGVKYGKDSSGSGLLVNVIKTLDASETNEERQREKLKIEKEFKKTDVRLNELVSKHDGDLTQVMQLFGQVSTMISTSRDKIHGVKESLLACKQLLRSRREEIQKLYKDAMQQKYVLEMLEQIDELRKTPQRVLTYMNKRHYLHATKVLMQAIDLSNGRLRDVEGLSELRQDLNTRRNQLYQRMIDELNKHLYQLSTSDALTDFQRRGSSTRYSNNQLTSPFQRNIIRRSTERAEANAKIRKALQEMAHGFDVDKTEVIDDSELLDNELITSYFIGIIVECFALLRKVPESLDALRVQIQPELLAIVTRTTQHLNAVMATENVGLVRVDESNHPLLELLELIYKQFKLIANAHNLLLKNYLNVSQRYGVTAKPYDIVDYWTQAQGVLQLVLTDYLDVQSTNNDERTNTNFAENNSNINSYFSRRKIQTRKTLFKFDKSTHLADDNSVKEHRRNASDVSNDDLLVNTLTSDRLKSERKLVCTPDPSLIRKIYLPLLRFSEEISDMMKTKPGHPNTFNEFVATHVKEVFLAKGHNRNLQNTIESLSKNHDAWRAIITPEEMKAFGLNRPLLQSTVVVESKITETKNLIRDLPNYSEDLLKMVCSLLKTYRETCQAAYRGIVQPETEDKRIYSVAWLKDEDICRFLKTLPNWTDLKSARSKAAGRKSLKSASLYMNSEEESPTQVQQRNVREAEMLTSNLGEGGISYQEILSDIGVLKELAILQESMEWFSSRITEFANDLRKPISCGANELGSSVVIKDGTIKVLTNLALEFDDLANTCLLVLHLEIRVQCFHYLRSSDKQNRQLKSANDSLEPDSKVLKLTKVLSDMDEAFNSTLHPRKTKYIFEGLAHLAARILIMASNSMENVDQASVQRMCRNAMTLQQTLSSITASREVALDHARNFYEMLYMEPEDILTNIIEKGAHYSEMQYLNALQLACKRKGITDSNSLATYQQKLSDILGTKPTLGVTV